MLKEKQKFLILGLGETGYACAKWLNKHGHEVFCSDTRSGHQNIEDFLKLGVSKNNIKFNLNKDNFLDHIDSSFDFVVVSPGLSPESDLLKAIVNFSQENEIKIISEIDLFYEAVKSNSKQIKIIGITGTNGKTTVTSMVRLMCEYAGLKSVEAGNISPSALTVVCEFEEKNSWPDVISLELSSAQLFYTDYICLDASTILNITQDHIDWHGSMEAYIASKKKIFSHSKIAVVDENQFKEFGLSNALVYRDSLPINKEDLGIKEVNGMKWFCTTDKNLMPVEAMKIRGNHNVLNAMAAMQLCRAIDLPFEPLLTALRDYEAHNHRCTYVRDIQGVNFIDDSKGTNVGATVAAIDGMYRNLVVILGGEGKGQDFTPLYESLRNRTKSNGLKGIVLIGKDKNILSHYLNIKDFKFEETIPVVVVNTIDEAVVESFKLAQSGDLVLLSPACASIDMFKNYHERGVKFVEAINELALSKGEIA
ncbi:UDP-N-acetylmuramoyl-L-alanine--D-glutamate ligase [Taylorella equigenitalis]|uniref:UDP-N-acetylmuramoyl-L-alanine--D-glutamate ligase n=1 Tax=Taylorella equigenitalis TaxID=29575 RepID=UPI0003FD5F76|nr:UDP-N-acetylmuramoyl-L-alanine--D-glutamate ligase [Taylorella equigenitalis]WDU47598.1 UDP-N-acetylmuramoyl-L-alanine--D-glutamate ligase [Taylorella equigenitalis]WEE00140.1 UDP-N-acetylmuramoyl-L-alanine--D-glutamate ligase [Taylorella equigenitalis]WEE01617.1 UDP-N-acetylmuramoyl-L-alanine--D-glutamate ligase [Taylorella equigenitalis]WFD78154.1 UDP-N-acetylmuramoyl-L-alanine--D-glutamate ligase [Taylorella equigenitalis]WFD79632.1 UDP-N-acetylmuramoyl-L-alanine--D-glutamate ligase [Tay